MAHISNGWDTRPILPPSQTCISKDASNGTIQRNPSSASKRHNTQYLASYSFSSKDDSTCCSPRDMIDKDRSLSSSENHDVSAVTSSLPIIVGCTKLPSTPDLDPLKSIAIESKDSYLFLKGKPTSSSQNMKGSTSSTPHSIKVSI